MLYNFRNLEILQGIPKGERLESLVFNTFIFHLSGSILKSISINKTGFAPALTIVCLYPI